MLKSLYVAVLTTVFLAGACSSQSPIEATSSSNEPMADAKPMLPAHPLPGERGGAFKGDQYDNYKLANGNTFGITSAPKSPMRAVGQWENHQALLLGWTGAFPATTAAIVKAAKPVIDVYVVHDGSNAKTQFLQALSQNGVSSQGIKYFNMKLNSIWMRDYGPLSVRSPDGTVSFVDPRYYHQRVYDDAVPSMIAAQWGINSFRQPLKWEGGTYIADGYGNCYYSQGVYWYGGTSQSKIHQYQKEYLGCDTNIVMKPLEDEGTTHSDMFAKLTSKNTMLIGSYKSSQDPGNKAVLDDDEAIVEAATLNDGGKVTVVRIPMPSNSNRQIWRTYANSLYINGVNLVPTYTDDTQYEAAAFNVWKSVLPTWNHVAVDSTDLITWSGAVHCITMTVPSGKLVKEQSDPSSLCSNKSFSCFPSNTQGGTCSLNFEGCCNLNSLQQCQNGQVTTVDCGMQGCGWSGQWKAYGCNGVGTGPANAPLACDAECIPNCSGKNCGSDGCGGSCGVCGENQSCLGGQCQNNTSNECGEVTYQGCCAGKTLKYCTQGQLVSQPCNSCGWDDGNKWYDCGESGPDPSGTYPKECPSECTPDCAGKQCGGDGCGGSCGSCGAAQTCNANSQCVVLCTSNCNGKNCGGDGCGGSCGSCAGEAVCVSGKCEEAAGGCGDVTFGGKCDANILVWCKDGELATFDCSSLGNFECKVEPDSEPLTYDCLAIGGNCTPDCNGKSCGADGCGGVCGQCDPGQNCLDGSCNTPVDPCDGLSFEGCCDGNVLNWCETSEKKQMDCDNSGCGWNPEGNNGKGWYDCNSKADGPAEFPKDCDGGTVCEPECDGKKCGGDGCGGNCGSCKVNQNCDAAGQCISNCIPSCIDKSCGDDGCGVSCGSCDAGMSCVAGNCVPAACQPKCEDKFCGDNSCGGSCGDCAENEDCNKFGQCVQKPTTCVPNCNNKQCGADGCDGNCGVCGKAQLCENGQCKDDPNAKCGNVPPIGMCDGDILKSCSSNGNIMEFNCAGVNKTCGQKPDGSFGCLDSGQCTPQCAGKQCGDNLCGGSCGSCPKDFFCNSDGQCVSNACVTQCDGRVCGFDGCNGTCGECGQGWDCTPQGQCEDAAKPCADGQILVDNQCVNGAGDGGDTGSELDAGADEGGCTCTSVGRSTKGAQSTGGFVLALLFAFGLATLRRQSAILRIKK